MNITSFASDTTTEGIRVQVTTKYTPTDTDPLESVRRFAYTIRISNEGTSAAKLLHRHWVITDSWGTMREVQGPGVVGHQPRLEPGEQFEYTSFCPLPTARGSMRGTYHMARDDGETFNVVIGEFFLFVPGEPN